jgi:hypothetical protein
MKYFNLVCGSSLDTKGLINTVEQEQDQRALIHSCQTQHIRVCLVPSLRTPQPLLD